MSSDPTNPGSCAACRLRREECVCVHAPRLCISTRLIVIIHSKEWRRTTNTGHFARLAIQDAEVRLHGSPKHPPCPPLAKGGSKQEPPLAKGGSGGVESASASTLVLFPGRGASPLSPAYIASLARPLTLLVPDGNWNQANHMMRRLPMLRQARPVSLPGPTLNLDKLRRNRRADRMSTFEAIAQALGILEGRETEAQLLRFFRQALQGMAFNSRRSARRSSRDHSPVIV